MAASSQEGYFTTKQAADAGYSPQLLAKHLRARRIARVRRGTYRLVHFPVLCRNRINAIRRHPDSSSGAFRRAALGI